MINTVDKCFGFVRDYGFHGPFAYQMNGAFYNDFVKDDLVISIIYDDRYWVEFIRTKDTFPGLNTGEIKLHQIDPKNLQFFDLTLLDRRQKIFNSVEFIDFDDKVLWYYSRLLRTHTHVLNGDLLRLKDSNKFLKLFRIRKKVSFQ